MRIAEPCLPRLPLSLALLLILSSLLSHSQVRALPQLQINQEIGEASAAARPTHKKIDYKRSFQKLCRKLLDHFKGSE